MGSNVIAPTDMMLHPSPFVRRLVISGCADCASGGYSTLLVRHFEAMRNWMEQMPGKNMAW